MKYSHLNDPIQLSKPGNNDLIILQKEIIQEILDRGFSFVKFHDGNIAKITSDDLEITQGDLHKFLIYIGRNPCFVCLEELNEPEIMAMKVSKIDKENYICDKCFYKR